MAIQSNIKLGQMQFHEHFDQPVRIVLKDGNPDISEGLHVCITEDGQETALKNLQTEYPQARLTVSDTVMGLALDNVLQRYEALYLYGFTPTTLIISKLDLEPIRDIVDSFCIMYASARGKLSVQEAFQHMKNKYFYYIGEPISMEQKSFGIEVMRRQKQDASTYEAVKLFLTTENAMKYNSANRSVNKDTLENLNHLWQGTYALIVEPHRNYWIEFIS